MDAVKNISLPESLLKEIQSAAQPEHRSVDEVLTDAVRRYVEERSWTKTLDYGAERARALGIQESDVDRLIAGIPGRKLHGRVIDSEEGVVVPGLSRFIRPGGRGRCPRFIYGGNARARAFMQRACPVRQRCSRVQTIRPRRGFRRCRFRPSCGIRTGRA
jgi:hypothetical protein